jgi:lambda family phage tail tape measure protein
MANIATLGIAVDSAPVDKGTASLGKFAGAARQAEAAANGATSSSRAHSTASVAAARAVYAEAAASLAAARASGTASKADIAAAMAAKNKASAALAAARASNAMEGASLAMARAASAEARGLDEATRAQNMHARAANQNSQYMQGAAANVGNLAAQFQDIGVTAAMGMSPLQIALQQGTQISAVLGPMGAAGAVKALGAAFMSVLSPVSLFVIAFVALAAAGLQMVDWAQTGAWLLSSLASVIETIAPAASVAGAALLLAFSPAILMSVVQLTAAIGRGLLAALYASAAAAAANPYIALALAFAAVVTAAYVFRDELAQIVGVDLVGVVKTGVNAIIGGFVGGYEAIKAVWSQLPAVLGGITASTANAVIGGIEGMINKAVAGINTLVEAANSAMASLPDSIRPSDIGSLGSVSLGRVENPNSGAAANAGSAAADAFAGAQGVDYAGAIGTGVASFARSATGALKDLSKALLTSEEDGKKAAKAADKAAKEAAKLAEAYRDIVTGAERHIAESQAEAAAIGQSAEQTARLKYQTDLLNQARDAGINLTAAQTAQLMGLGAQMASSEAATSRLTAAFDFAKDATSGFLSDLRSGLANGEGFFQSFGKAALNVLDKIIDKLQTNLVDALFSASSAASGAGGGGGGLISSIFGGIGSLFGFAGGGYTGAGGRNQPAGVVHRGEYVMSAGATSRIGIGNLDRMHNSAKRGYAEGGFVGGKSRAAANDAPQQVAVRVFVDETGNWQAKVEGIADQRASYQVQKGQEQAQRTLMPLQGDKRRRGLS